MINPRECFSVVRNKTFAVEDNLTPLEEDDLSLKLYNEKFSRFVFTIIGEDKKFSKANLPRREIAEMLTRSKFAKDESLRRELNPSNGQPDLPAYQVKLTAGAKKGKTPAEIIQNEGVNGAKFLNEHYSWLKENLVLYPQNKTVMDAIINAGQLYANNDLLATEKSVFNILDIKTRPLIRKQDEEGNCFVYEISINWMFGNDYPVNIEITNYYAPVVEKENGLLNVVKKKRVNNISNDIYLSSSEWEDCIRTIERQQRIFEQTFGPYCLDKCIQKARAYREN